VRSGRNAEGQIHDARFEYALGSNERDALALELKALPEELPRKDISKGCGLTGEPVKRRQTDSEIAVSPIHVRVLHGNADKLSVFEPQPVPKIELNWTAER
jgi:hypothetical protein